MSHEDTKSKENFLKGRIKLSESIILAAVPLFAYLLIYIYEYGYLRVFEIPLQFITFNINEVFVVTSSLLGFAWLLFGIVNIGFTVYPASKIPKSIASRMFVLFPLLILLLAFFFLYGRAWREWTPLLVVILSTVAIMFLPPVFSRRFKGTYLDKMEAIDKKSKEADDLVGDTLIDKTVQSIGPKNFVYLMYLVLVLYIVFQAGRAAAINQKVFRIVNTSPESVVLLISNEKIIVCK